MRKQSLAMCYLLTIHGQTLNFPRSSQHRNCSRMQQILRRNRRLCLLQRTRSSPSLPTLGMLWKQDWETCTISFLNRSRVSPRPSSSDLVIPRSLQDWKAQSVLALKINEAWRMASSQAKMKIISISTVQTPLQSYSRSKCSILLLLLVQIPV